MKDNNYHIKITRTTQSRLSEVDFENIPFGRVMSDHMFVADYDGMEWTNPRVEPFGPLELHPATMALHYGQSIFEGMKASKSVDGKALLFRPEEHASRINFSARRMCMPEIPEQLFLDAVHTLVDIDQDWIPPIEGSALYLRPFVFATDEFIGVAPSVKYKFVIFTCPVGPYYSTPVKLYAEHTYVRAAVGGTGEAKAAGNYAGSLLPAKLAQEKGYNQILWLDAKEFKYVQEVGTMNLFFVFNDEVVTPMTDGAILRGITRKTLIQVLKERGMNVVERLLSLDEIKERYAKGELIEVFGSGTAAVVANVASLTDGEENLTFDESNYTLSRELKAYIDGIRAGTTEDTHGWIVPVKSLS